MKSLISILVVMAAACLSACGSKTGGGSTPPPSNANEWTWAGGSNVVDQPGTYGALRMASPSNVPGAREQAVSWTDASGNFWLFGGIGYDSTGNSEFTFNDLWKYSAGEWTWMSGANVAGQSGVYGTQGVAAAGNVPGARFGAVGSTDRDGNLWLFGGYFASPSGPNGNGILNDLWEYSAGQWTWISGSDAFNQVGTYGTQGIAAPGNVPGARSGAASWFDASGNFWLFGGSGVDLSGNCCTPLNDLWEYSAGKWTWIGGSNISNQFNLSGNYGIQGTAAPNNIPGARSGASSWTDATGNFWLFGGSGLDNGGQGILNDLWKYSAGEWTWMSGSSSPDQVGTYGAQGVASPFNVPGARFGAVSWTDTSGNLWLFGGADYDLTGAGGTFGDLWKYSAGEWTWVGGSSVVNQPGTYGNQGEAAPGNNPGARYFALGWTDASGNFWLFGGQNGITDTLSQNPSSSLNDLWRYEP
jgi:Kelch motif